MMTEKTTEKTTEKKIEKKNTIKLIRNSTGVVLATLKVDRVTDEIIDKFVDIYYSSWADGSEIDSWFRIVKKDDGNYGVRVIKVFDPDFRVEVV